MIALLLALAIGGAGLDGALAQGSEKITHTRLSIGNTPRQICLYDIFEVDVKVVRGVDFPSGRSSLFTRPGIGITASSRDPNVVSLLGEADLAPLTGGTTFKFRGDKAGRTTLVFNAVVTLVRGELAIGSTPAEPNRAEALIQMEVVECAFDVTTIGQWSVPGPANISISAVSDDAEVKAQDGGSDAGGESVSLVANTSGGPALQGPGPLTGSTTVNWVGSADQVGDCIGTITIGSSQLDWTGVMDDSGQLTLNGTYQPAAGSIHQNCRGVQGDVALELIPDPLQVSLASSGGVYNQSQALEGPEGPISGSVTIIVVPKDEETATLSPKPQAALSPWLFIASVCLILTPTFKGGGKNPKKKSLSKPWPLVLLIILPLLVLSACSSGAGGPPLEPEADLVYGPGDFIFPETNAGLADLSSYKATLTLTFDGTRGGQAEHRTETYVMVSTKEPAARHLLIVTAGAVPELEPVFLAEEDGAAYEQRGENACSATAIDPENSLIDGLAPAGLLTPVIGAEEAGSETVNDVPSTHYTFDERAFGLIGLASSTGEMWVASEGGYIVRYVVTTEGEAAYFGEGIEGTLTWDYELTDVNQPVSFALPADCPAGMVNAPLLPDATNILNMPSILTYDTASNITDAAAFYREQIPNLGWTLIGEPGVTETSALMEFTQGNQTMTVIITTDAVVTTVNILLEKVQE